MTILINCKDSSFDLIDVVGKKQAEAAATKQAPSIILNGKGTFYSEDVGEMVKMPFI